MASAAAVEELLAVRAQPGRDVLEIRHRRRRAAEDGGVEEATPYGEQRERGEAAADLEAPVGDVLVRNPVARHVQRRADKESERPRAQESAGRAAGRHVERDDHDLMMAYAPPVMSFLDRLRNLISGPPHIAGGGDPEAEADLHEEFGTPDATEADLKGMAETGGRGGLTGRGAALTGGGSFGTAEAAEAGEAELESEEAPPDPDP